MSIHARVVAVVPTDGISPRGDQGQGPSDGISPRGDQGRADDLTGRRGDAAPVAPGAERSGRVPVSYRIVVRGEITERFAEPLEEVTVESAGAQSILRAEIVDQAKLQAVLGWLFDHGVDLVSLCPAEEITPSGGERPR